MLLRPLVITDIIDTRCLGPLHFHPRTGNLVRVMQTSSQHVLNFIANAYKCIGFQAPFWTLCHYGLAVLAKRVVLFVALKKMALLFSKVLLVDCIHQCGYVGHDTVAYCRCGSLHMKFTYCSILH